MKKIDGAAKNGKAVVARFFQGISEKFKAHVDWISSGIDHSGEQGRSNENILLDFLENNLPERFSVGSGKAFSYEGGISKQLDVIVYDRYNSIPAFNEGRFVFTPIETVYCGIEVKTTLNKREMKDASEKSESLLTLRQIGGRMKKPFFCCFAYNLQSLKMQEIRDAMRERNNLHLVCVNGKGIVTKGKTKYELIEKPGEALLLFWAKLIDLLDEQGEKKFSATSYLKDIALPRNDLW